MKRGWWRMSVAALVVLAQLEVLRTLYPPGYALVGELGFIVTPLVLLTVFVAPLGAALLGRLAPRTVWWTAVLLVVGSRVAVQLLASTVAAPLAVAVPATIATLAGGTAVLAILLGPGDDARVVAAGFMVGLVIDVTLKGAFGGWDRVWWSVADGGLAALAVTLAVCAGMVVAAMRVGPPEVVREAEGAGWALASFALLAMPTMTIVASPAFVAASSGWTMAATVAALGTAGALGVIVSMLAGGERRARGVLVVAAVGATVAIWLLSDAAGSTVIVLVTVAMSALGAIAGSVVRLIGPGRRSGLRSSAVGATGGWLIAFVLTLLYPMHYELVLPMGNRVLAPVAVAAVAVVMFGARHDHPARPAVRPAFTLGVALLGGTALVAGALAWSRPSVETIDAPASIRMATFNVDQSMTDGGAVDFRATEEAITALDSDIVALQEVGRGWALSGFNDFLSWYRQRHPDELVWAWAADHQFGNVLISRVRLDGARRLDLPQGEGSMRRSAIVATVPSEDGAITVIAVHLQHRNSEAGIAARRAELEVILEEWGGEPRTVMLGDFNADNRRSPDGGAKLLESPDHANTLQPLLDAGFVTSQSTTVCTDPTSNDNCSDFILVTPDLALVDGVEVLPQQEIGDHRPIRAVIRST